jgi:hypothetical protein
VCQLTTTALHEDFGSLVSRTPALDHPPVDIDPILRHARTLIESALRPRS